MTFFGRINYRRFFTVIVGCLLLAQLLAGCFGQSSNRSTSFVYPPFKSHLGFARFGAFDLRLFLGNKARFDDPQGVALLIAPDNPSPILICANSGQNNLLLCPLEFSFGLFKFHSPWPKLVYPDNDQTKSLDNPVGVASGDMGSFYVVDRGNSRIVKLIIGSSGNDFAIPSVSRTIGSLGSEPGQFLDPRGVVIVGDSKIAVIDNGLNRVTILDDDGNVQTFWEGLTDPVAIASSAAFHRNTKPIDEPEFLIVIDSLDRRVTKFDFDGSVVNQIDAMTWNAPLTPKLSFVAIDRYRQILITDRNNGSIHKLDRNLNYLGRFGESGRGCYQFDQPRGIAVDWESGKVFVVERERLQTLLVAVDVLQFNAAVVEDSTWRDLAIDFTTTEPALADFDLVDRYDRFIARIVEGRLFDAGSNHIAWGLKIPSTLPDGKPLPALPTPCKAGELLPDGDYKLKGFFRATYGSKDFFIREVEADFQLKR